MDKSTKIDIDQNKEEKETQSQILIRLATDVELFHTAEGEPFASFKVKDRCETWPLKGEGFKLWLTKRFYEETGKAAGGQGLADALNVLNAKAIFEGRKQPVFTRVAEKDNVIYIDLCNESWEAVKVDDKGWEIVSNPPVKFKRSRITEEIPKPIRGGSLDELRSYINYKNETDWILIIAWLLTSLRPASPYPILTIQGEQGSSKSTTTKVLRAIIDPSAMPLRGLPKEERDFSIAANNTWVLAFDNLSGLSNTMSDALCKLSTGGGLATRKLYSDDDETVFNIMRPAILNGIDDIAKRQDLLDRSLVLFLPSIPEIKRTDEKTFWESFKKAHPRILGALLDVLSGAIKELPHTSLTAKPRMADFAQWATSAERALGWENGKFMNAYNRNRNEAIDQGLESDPVAVAVQAFMKGQSIWEGTAAETLVELTKYTGDEGTKYSKAWPSSRRLKERLRRIATALRTKGIEFTDLGRTNKGATLRLEKAVETSILSTSSTQTMLNQQLSDDQMKIKFKGEVVGDSSSLFKAVNHITCDDSDDNEYKNPILSNYEKSGLI
ncbi:hypothetical protein V7148_20535 [Gottfriedia acidiceleris]|uniref:hypothetical protein n=1 Tax=Gottfriedia acidiceleris TaxID=371036 RepID=UPI002FFE44FE